MIDQNPTAKNHAFSVEVGVTSLWVNHIEGTCVARFGLHGFEVQGMVGRPCRPRSSRADWEEFRSLVADAYGLRLKDRQCPQVVRDNDPSWKLSDDEIDIFLAPTLSVAKRFNPFRTNVWGFAPPTYAEVAACLASDHRRSEPWNEDCGRDEHIARIAFLIEEWSRYGALDPITLSCHDLRGEHVVVLDGYHRLSAAIYRQRHRFPDSSWICVTYDGFEDGFHAAFPKAVPIPPNFPRYAPNIDMPSDLNLMK